MIIHDAVRVSPVIVLGPLIERGDERLFPWVAAHDGVPFAGLSNWGGEADGVPGLTPQEHFARLTAFLAERAGRAVDIKVAKDLQEMDRIIASLWPGESVSKLMFTRGFELMAAPALLN